MFPRVLAITVLAAVGALTAPAAAQAATPAAGSTLAPRPSGVPAHRAGAPLILGHRGGTERGYQNSMAAFNDAIGLHLDYIETDVRHTADGVAVLIHDPTLPAACTLHPGVGVSALSAAELAKVRCAGQAVPRLTDLVTRLTQPDARHVGAMAEVKDVDPLGIRDALAPLGWHRVIIESFLWPALAQIEAASPQVITCPLGVAAATLQQALAVTHDCIAPSATAVTSDLVTGAHRAGAAILAWTVDDPNTMRSLANQGVDGIITDNPRTALALFHPGR